MTKNASRKKYHYIYKTTCLITGKYYLGMHSTDNLDDGYIGSGKRLWYSINKHGKENHKCEILEFLPDRPSLRAREAELVCEDQISDPMCMNLTLGGEGGWDHLSGESQYHPLKENPDLAKRVGSIRGRMHAQKLKEDPEYKSRYTKSLSEACQGKPSSYGMLGKNHSQKTKASMSDNHKGKKNSQYGSVWVWRADNLISKKVSKDLVEDYIAQGWIRGRRIKK